LAVGQETWTVYVTHLNHLAESVRDREVAALLDIVSRYDEDVHVLLGDFNTLAPADYAGCPEELERQDAEVRGGEDAEGQRELLPLRVVPRVLRAGYADAWAAAAANGRGGTWPALSPRVRIDYLFVPPAMRERLVACQVLDGESVCRASDHRPVLAEFR
jgi:endonuclease/exonuclease/phosphatase family metal-dependent hydrolase